MKFSDIADSITIDPRKLTHYALNKESPFGKHKALLFEKLLGFTKDNYDRLLQQLENKALQTEAAFHSEDKFGKRYTVDIMVEGLEKKTALVRTGWIIPHGSKEAKLATLYIQKPGRR